MASEIQGAKRNFIKQRLKDDSLSADLQWSLLIAALSSYRHDTVLRPFPPMFMGQSSDHRDYAALEKVCDKMKPMGQVCQDLNQLGEKSLELLHWALDAKNFTLKSCQKEKYSVIQDLTGQIVPVPPPNFVFEVVYKQAAEDKFLERRAGRDVMYAYHGSRIENFFSILHHGLNSHMNKNALFGEGTYLSSELSVSMPYCPAGKAWDLSRLGTSLSCIAVCELIDDPSVKCQTKDKENGSSSASSGRSRSHIPGSMGGEVPEKYYVVRNNEMLRVKYLLLYAAKKQKRRAAQWEWVQRHKFVIAMVMYIVLLVLVGLYNSRTFQAYVRRYLKG